MKKIFIKLANFLGYEIIDQNNFSSPTLDKRLNEDLSTFNHKSIVLPLKSVVKRSASSSCIVDADFISTK